MNIDSENRSRLEGNDVRYYPACCCWPGTRTPFGLAVFGGILTLIGALWLMAELGLLPSVMNISLWPVVLIMIGISYLINSFSRRE